MSKQEQKFSNFPNVTVGTIFSESWGWEQTNVNFYEVVSRTEKMVTIREIGQKTVKEETAMSSYVVADKGNFISDEICRKKIKGGGKHIYLEMTSFSVATVTSENERHFTSSWA